MAQASVSRRALLRLLGGASIALLAGCGGAAAPIVAKPAVATSGGHDTALADEYWIKSGGDDLLRGKTFQQLFDGLPDKMKAFQLKDTYLRCIDEGVPGGLHMAGSGCLYERAEQDLRGKITGIYTHEGCGAAKLYVESKGIKTDNPDSVADEEAKKLAAKLGVPYLGRITAQQMSRPAALHDARAIYYDGTGKFEPTQINGLPKGFMISRKLISDPAYAQAEVDVAIGIALGDHGLGAHFTGKSPLYICCVGGLELTSLPTRVMAEEMQAVSAKYPQVEIHTLLAGREVAEPAKPVVKAADPSYVPEAARGDEHGEGQFGPTYIIRDRLVNLADRSGRRYLRFSIAIEFAEHHEPSGTYQEAWSRLISYRPERDGFQEMTGGGKDAEAAFQAQVKKYVPAMEDAVSRILSSKTVEQVSSPEGREQAKKEIKNALTRLLAGTGMTVTNVYFTEFVIQ